MDIYIYTYIYTRMYVYIYIYTQNQKQGRNFGAWWNNWTSLIQFAMAYNQGHNRAFPLKTWFKNDPWRMYCNPMQTLYDSILPSAFLLTFLFEITHTHMDIFYCNRTRFSGSHSSLGNKIRNCDGCTVPERPPCPRLWRPCTRLGWKMFSWFCDVVQSFQISILKIEFQSFPF